MLRTEADLLRSLDSGGGWCQRWRDGGHSWRHRHEGGFDANRYEVAPVDEQPARRFVETHHYSGAWCNAKRRYGLYEGTDLVGVLVLGLPMGANVLTNPLPGLVPFEESIELSRLVLLDRVPANAESWFTARVFRLAAEEGLRGVVAFSDPTPRRRHDGGLVLPGHVGTVYQALGATYTGLSTARTVSLLPDGTVFSDRTKSKVTGGERGRDGAIARLVARGARAPEAGEDPARWLAGALKAAGAKPMRHHGCHRYVFRIGRTRAERTRTVIGLAARAYPKRDEGRQLDLFEAVPA